MVTVSDSNMDNFYIATAVLLGLGIVLRLLIFFAEVRKGKEVVKDGQRTTLALKNFLNMYLVGASCFLLLVWVIMFTIHINFLGVSEDVTGGYNLKQYGVALMFTLLTTIALAIIFYIVAINKIFGDNKISFYDTLYSAFILFFIFAIIIFIVFLIDYSTSEAGKFPLTTPYILQTQNPERHGLVKADPDLIIWAGVVFGLFVLFLFLGVFFSKNFQLEAEAARNAT